MVQSAQPVMWLEALPQEILDTLCEAHCYTTTDAAAVYMACGIDDFDALAQMQQRRRNALHPGLAEVAGLRTRPSLPLLHTGQTAVRQTFEAPITSRGLWFGGGISWLSARSDGAHSYLEQATHNMLQHWGRNTHHQRGQAAVIMQGVLFGIMLSGAAAGLCAEWGYKRILRNVGDNALGAAHMRGRREALAAMSQKPGIAPMLAGAHAAWERDAAQQSYKARMTNRGTIGWMTLSLGCAAVAMGLAALYLGVVGAACVFCVLLGAVTLSLQAHNPHAAMSLHDAADCVADAGFQAEIDTLRAAVLGTA